MSKLFSKILYGGDYNPNQWGKDVWEQDLRMFQKAKINSATVNVFAWAKIQPSEERYDFSELDEIISMLSQKDMDIVLATATGATPAWMVKRYPEVARTDYEGRHHKFGQRHNACPNSLVYQRYAKRLAELLAERYGDNEHIVCWHVNNEYGGICYCEHCEKAFRIWLRKRYQILETLNKAWNLEFWGHTIYDWDEIVAPNALGEGLAEDKTAFAGISIDYCRFNSDSMLENYKMERDAIRKYDATTPITTNLMGTYKQLDYFKWAKEMDVISWDNYPTYKTPWSAVAMRHDLMRGLKQQPFMLMEQTPSQQNWQAYNSLKKPGQMRAQSYQSIAHGADTIQFFQLHRSVGGCEKFHGAVIEHAGTEDTRVFREVVQLGCELEALGTDVLGAINPAKVGIIFDWDNYWALEYTSGPSVDLRYVDQIHQYYSWFYENNIPVDMIHVEADFSRYSVVVAPVLYMVKADMAELLENYVQGGGVLVTGFMSGIVDQSDNVHLGGYPGPLRKMAGIWVEEIDALAPEQYNTIRFVDGQEAQCGLLSDIIHTEAAVGLANYTNNFYAGSPAITQNTYGKGSVFYIGTQLEKEALNRVLTQVIEYTDIQACVDEKTRLEITCRVSAEKCFYFIMNFRTEVLPLPERFVGMLDRLTGKVLQKGEMLQPYDTILLVTNYGLM